MSDWKTIEEYPDYEMTVDGRIRLVHGRKVVSIYESRLKVGGPLYQRVRLQRRGVPIALTVRDLIKQTFPVYVQEKPVIRPPLKKFKTNVAPDGTDLSKEEWRRIPGFMSYQCTSKGYVRHRETRLVLKETVTKQNVFYNLWEGGVSYSRGRNGLRYLAFPELLEGYAPIPSFPMYRITVRGEVMGPRWEILPYTKSGSVHLRKDKKRYVVKPSDLAFEAWGRYQLKDAA